MRSQHTTLTLILAALLALNQGHYGSEAASFTPLKNHFDFACVAENLKETNNYFCDSQGHVRCLPGWSDPSSWCTVPICEMNNQTCVNGMCSKPYTCECEIGWWGQFCEKCVPLPGCLYGTCNRSLECICDEGYEGMTCDKPVCPGCVHGECLMPGMCTCHPGWSGPNCTVCEERSDCKFGRCVDEPFQCSCLCNYEGVNCEKPVCKEGCHPENGFCEVPEQCWCKPGWTGENCDECVPYHSCVHGSCKKPYECNCEKGWFGSNCNSTKENEDGNWGEWSEWSSCSRSCEPAGLRTRSRKCDSPAPIGNGTYCSHDGSDCTEDEPCNDQVDCGDPTTTTPPPTDITITLPPTDITLPPIDTTSTSSDGPPPTITTEENTTPEGRGVPVSTSTPPTPTPRAQYPRFGRNDDSFLDIQQLNSDDARGRFTRSALGWSAWSKWSECSTICGGGSTYRVRSCMDPQICGGSPHQEEVGTCNQHQCP